jgi:hypothetical protein
LIKDAAVKGSGMDAADLVWMTVLSAVSGEANIAMVMATPHGPISEAGFDTGDTARRRVVIITM